MKFLVVFLLGVLFALVSLFIYDAVTFRSLSPLGIEEAGVLKPLEQYELLTLAQREAKITKITLENVIASQDKFTSYLFSFTTDGKKVTGLLNIPKGAGPFPVIVQFRGYVDRERYATGEGTKRSGEVYAQNGFITIAPDFLGYGGSDQPSSRPLEDRFETYTTALDLLASISTLAQANKDRIALWGHSNGGHIALTVLAITGKSYPTTLWAPVSKPFPYSVLYFTDEFPDGGKYLRGELARFEGLYGVDAFTFRTYLDRISAAILLHQGTADDAVPVAWSDEFVETMKAKKKNITYYRYPGADHNMLGSWSTVIERDLSFFNQQ